MVRAAGKPSLVIDATLAPSPIQQCKRDKSYKQWLIQVILEKVEERMGVELSRSECWTSAISVVRHTDLTSALQTIPNQTSNPREPLSPEEQ